MVNEISILISFELAAEGAVWSKTTKTNLLDKLAKALLLGNLVGGELAPYECRFGGEIQSQRRV